MFLLGEFEWINCQLGWICPWEEWKSLLFCVLYAVSKLNRSLIFYFPVLWQESFCLRCVDGGAWMLRACIHMKSGYHGLLIFVLVNQESQFWKVCSMLFGGIWKFRNSLVFVLTVPRKETIYDDIITLTYAWCSNRSKYKINWVTWMKYPISAII